MLGDWWLHLQKLNVAYSSSVKSQAKAPFHTSLLASPIICLGQGTSAFRFRAPVFGAILRNPRESAPSFPSRNEDCGSRARTGSATAFFVEVESSGLSDRAGESAATAEVAVADADADDEQQALPVLHDALRWRRRAWESLAT